jgi:hypothetical protein
MDGPERVLRPLEQRTVSRKTPVDGKLEITKPIADRLERLAGGLSVQVDHETGSGSLGTYECTCRGPENRHVHFFLQSDALKTLVPDARVSLDLDEEAACIHVRSA